MHHHRQASASDYFQNVFRHRRQFWGNKQTLKITWAAMKRASPLMMPKLFREKKRSSCFALKTKWNSLLGVPIISC
jgi:hypothetical protein